MAIPLFVIIFNSLFSCWPIAFDGCSDGCSSSADYMDSAFDLFDRTYIHRRIESGILPKRMNEILKDSELTYVYTEKKMPIREYTALFLVVKRNKQRVRFLVWKRNKKDSLDTNSQFFPALGPILVNDKLIRKLYRYVHGCSKMKW